MAPDNVTGAIVYTARPVSRAVAGFLEAAEPHVWRDEPSLSLTVDDLLERVRDWRHGPASITNALAALPAIAWNDIDQTIAAMERRLCALALDHHRHGKRGSHRPDVLALTCALLANYEHPYTLSLIEYAISVALQSLYDVRYDATSLAALRRAYDDLVTRRAQQSWRIRKEGAGAGAEAFLIDLLCLHGFVYRGATGPNLPAYYHGFDDPRRPFGVDTTARLRWFDPGTDWPQLHGELPAFSTLLGLAFNQPTCIPGIDEVTGGLLPMMAGVPGSAAGGVITLLAGPPGSGKTTLAMALGARMADLGTQVAYVTSEESRESLDAKLKSLIDPGRLAATLWPAATLASLTRRFAAHTDGTLSKLRQVVDRILQDLSASPPPALRSGDAQIAFRYAVIVDGVATLLAGGTASRLGTSERFRRHDLSAMLNELRAAGVCVFLIGEKTHMVDSDLAYLVDNVFQVSIEPIQDEKHSQRVFRVEKTRLQASHRGTHVLHLSRHEGPTVSPSLHSALQTFDKRERSSSEHPARIVLCASAIRQASLPGIDTNERVRRRITLKVPSHVLIYGWGPSGKARLALSIAFECQVTTSEEPTYLVARAEGDQETLARFHRQWFPQLRILVVSFLYSSHYYEDITRALLKSRGRDASVADVLSVEALYPGYLDPETLVHKLRRRLASARLEGRPYTTVIIDGLHNMLLQYPLLTRDTLLWPTVLRLLRSERVSAISTFTFFQVTRSRKDATIDQHDVPDDAKRMFHHLLVGNCDYTLLVTKPTDARFATIERITTISDRKEERENEFRWDGDGLRCLLGPADD